MKKGLVFSLSMLILLLSFMLLIQSTTRTSTSQTEKTITTFQRAANYYENLYQNSIELPKNSSLKEAAQRVLSFKYGIDQNYFTISYSVPSRAATIGNYFDLINSFKIFVEDKNYSNSFTGIDANISTVQNTAWGGTTDTLNFIIEPQCMNIAIREKGLEFSKAGCGTFDLTTATQIDTNFTINTPEEDLNAITCNWNGTPGCPNQIFDPLDTRPFFSLEIFDQNCTECGFLAKTAKGHFDTAQDNWIAVHCIGSTCTSPQIDINLTTNFSITRNTNAIPLSASTGILLKSKIKDFYFNDLNIMVSAKDINLSMETTK